MTRASFENNLRKAIRSTLQATRRVVSNELPDEVRLLVVPNCSFDGNPLQDDEEVYPGEELPQWTTLPPRSEAEVVELLYRKGKVPEWIDIHVDSADGQYSILILQCCGRFTAMQKHLYHQAGGIPPFNPQVRLPSLDYDLATHGKFQLQPRYTKRSEPGR